MIQRKRGNFFFLFFLKYDDAFVVRGGGKFMGRLSRFFSGYDVR